MGVGYQRITQILKEQLPANYLGASIGSSHRSTQMRHQGIKNNSLGMPGVMGGTFLTQQVQYYYFYPTTETNNSALAFSRLNDVDICRLNIITKIVSVQQTNDYF